MCLHAALGAAHGRRGAGDGEPPAEIRESALNRGAVIDGEQHEHHERGPHGQQRDLGAAAVADRLPHPRERGAGEEPARPFHLAEHVGPDALAYVTVDDLGEAWKRFPQTPLGRIFAEPEVAEVLEKLQVFAEDAATSGVSAMGTLPVKLRAKAGEVQGKLGRRRRREPASATC